MKCQCRKNFGGSCDEECDGESVTNAVYDSGGVMFAFPACARHIGELISDARIVAYDDDELAVYEVLRS